MIQRMRRWRTAALATLVVSLHVGPSTARSYRLVEGDSQKCAPYVELMSQPIRGPFQHNWYPGGEVGIRSIGDFGSLILLSRPSPVSLSVVQWPRDESVFQGEFLTFRFIAHPGGGAGAARTFRSLSECATDATDQNACVLNDDALAVKFRLPTLDATRTRDTLRLGNHYFFYRYKDRYWLTISQSMGSRPPSSRFGFAVATPASVAAGQVNSLFDFGCRVDD